MSKHVTASILADKVAKICSETHVCSLEMVSNSEVARQMCVALQQIFVIPIPLQECL